MTGFIAENELILLDTNILAHLLRGNDCGKKIERSYSLSSRRERPLLSSIVEGELKGLARRWNWGNEKLERLDHSLQELVKISAGESEVVNAYSILYELSVRKGAGVGENDLWIAATSLVTKSVLLTADRDFLRLEHPQFRCEFFNQNS